MKEEITMLKANILNLDNTKDFILRLVFCKRLQIKNIKFKKSQM